MISQWIYPLYRCNNLLPGGKSHNINFIFNDDPPMCYKRVRDLFNRTKVHVSFSSEEEAFGNRKLAEFGLNEQAKFICFSGRDKAYLGSQFPRRNWSYHNYRDVNINNFMPAIEEIVNRGYFAFRMGAVVDKPLVAANQKIIDYSTKYRTEFLDIFLCAKCAFYLGGGDGLVGIPQMFRKSLIMTNLIPLGRPLLLDRGLFIPKKLWIKGERRFMTFREVVKSDLGFALRAEQYARVGVEVIENTPEEIRDIVMEMDERIKGIWKTTEEDEELQKRFWSVFKSEDLNKGFRSRIGREFLRQNQGLLS